ncbi:InlB B-repeat-containing protein [Anaeromyxobacter oryzae]|uniref:Bacterial repeat domain-containing protein n=1 Tax=Anaeromyxobacter oryzae TaxID=2918170 RepID=A0ABM7WWW6_9BACT|nr:hypothetical protein [Anaeromyxobacter oryzae]BDG03922.1 hypothetical protein AMOR_29180 [Anaeromyxobacter oryzae]
MRVARASLLAVLAVGVACGGSGGGGGGGGGGGNGGGNEVATLQLSTDGAGEIEVSGGAAAHCRGSCAVTAAPGTSVTLVAHPDVGQVFEGWSGACGGTGDCSLALTGTLAVSARFVAAQPPPPGRHALSVQHAGEGDGRVTSQPGGIDCGSACRADYDDGTVVTLTATAGADSRFESWGGACSGSGSCVVTVTGDAVVTATFARTTPPPPAQHVVAVQRAGDGTGKVTSAPAGIDCGGACSASFDDGATVTLTATPDAGSTFGGWSGACSGTVACVLKADRDLTVTATFGKIPPPPPGKHAIAVQKAGDGGGKVTSKPAGIDCGAACGASFEDGTSVTLTATPDAGSTFGGWGGACSGTGSCVVKLDKDVTVTATFTKTPPPPPAKHTVAVQKAGNGSGRVMSAPVGIDCGTTCSAAFEANAFMTLSATADAGSTFQGWSGACGGTGACVVKVEKDVTVTATFTKTAPTPPGKHTVAVQKAGDGSGKVTSAPAGIECGELCSAPFDEKTSVTLTAKPDEGSTFQGWGGACTGTSACVVTVDKDLMVMATFAKVPPPPPAKRTVTVEIRGAEGGAGKVTSAPAGIDCSSSCSAPFDENTSVTLTAMPDAVSTFQGWGGACTGTSTCVVKVDKDLTVTATFMKTTPPPPAKHKLTVEIQGVGGGTGKVTSAPGGIKCDASCSAEFDEKTSVTLTAMQGEGSTFQGWGGACTGTSACVVTVDKDLMVMATFAKVPPPPPAKHELEVQKSGDGSGTVTSAPSGIDCGKTCSAEFDTGTSVTLAAKPDEGSTFQGWGGACTGTGACVVTVDKDLMVMATFAKVPPPPPGKHAVAVLKTGDGGGTVTSAPSGIDCGKTCTASFDDGATVTLAATPDAGSTFSGWSGACSGTGACVVKVDEDVTVTVAFAKPYTAFELIIPGGTVMGGGINRSGDVAGTLQEDSGGFTRAFLYVAATKTVTFLSPIDRNFSAVAVNDTGTVVVNDDVSGRVYRWSDGKLEEIDKPAAGKGTAINALGWVVGWMFPDDGSARGFVNDGKETRTLVPLPGTEFAVANAVNRDGVVVGTSGTKAVRFDGSNPVELPVGAVAMALGVNDAGFVVGSADQQGKTIHGFLLDLRTDPPTVTIVPGLEKDFGVAFHDVNATGTVVGSGARLDGSGRAVVYRDGQLQSLEDLVSPQAFQLENAVDVNDAGQILVWGRDDDGRSHTVILTPR